MSGRLCPHMRCSPFGWRFGPLLLAGLIYTPLVGRQHVRRVNTIPVYPDARESVLEDVSRHVVLLINSFSLVAKGERNVAVPKLLLWNAQSRMFLPEVPLPDWPRWRDKLPARVGGGDRFAFQGDGERVIALQTPWLALIDLATKAEIRRVLPSKEYLSPDSPGRAFYETGGPQFDCMAVSPQSGAVAVAYNIWMDTKLYIYDPRLETQIASSQLPAASAVQSLCWSPDGRKLAVLLYSGPVTLKRDSSPAFRQGAPRDPDMWILDPHSGKTLSKFVTGYSQAQILFGTDSQAVYVVNSVDYHFPTHKGEIQAFSAATGELLQTMTAGPEGIHSSLCLSPNGRFIAADASTHVPQGLHLEPIWGAKIARVVLLDAKTGKPLFEHHEKTEREVWDPLRLAFSPDGRFLYVDFPLSEAEPHEHIEVFSLDAL
jgi:hypothetical protein